MSRTRFSQGLCRIEVSMSSSTLNEWSPGAPSEDSTVLGRPTTRHNGLMNTSTLVGRSVCLFITQQISCPSPRLVRRRILSGPSYLSQVTATEVVRPRVEPTATGRASAVRRQRTETPLGEQLSLVSCSVASRWMSSLLSVQCHISRRPLVMTPVAGKRRRAGLS